MDAPPPATDAEALRTLILRLEALEARIHTAEQASRDLFADLTRECHDLITDAKIQAHTLIREADRIGYDLIPDLPIADKKLKDAWIALFRHASGATADTVAEDLHRHRTTVSTYLNTLVLMGLAEKERTGHEIFYKAVMRPHRESPQ